MLMFCKCTFSEIKCLLHQEVPTVSLALLTEEAELKTRFIRGHIGKEFVLLLLPLRDSIVLLIATSWIQSGFFSIFLHLCFPCCFFIIHHWPNNQVLHVECAKYATNNTHRVTCGTVET
uniref:Uncharacterized protein n=1 Tax=Sphaerodactylus townsendi TaxID=933632 RepID=A0ACB8FQQ3_9SAUR